MAQDDDLADDSMDPEQENEASEPGHPRRSATAFIDFRAELWQAQSKAQRKSHLEVQPLQSLWGRKVSWALRTGFAVLLSCFYAVDQRVQKASWQTATVFACVTAIASVSGPSLGATCHHAWDMWAGSALGSLASMIVNECLRYIAPRGLQIACEIVCLLLLTFWMTSRPGGVGFKRFAVGVLICGMINMTVSEYDHAWYFPCRVLVPCTVGPLAAVISMILPFPCLAVVELRHRLAFQALIERAVLCEQYEAISNKTVAAVTTADQLGETIRDDFAEIKAMLAPAKVELFFFPAAYERLERIVAIHATILQKVRSVQNTLRKSPAGVTATHVKFHSFTAQHWRAALKALAALNDDIVAAEQHRRLVRADVVKAARQAQQDLNRACEEARREVIFTGGSQYAPPEHGEDRPQEHSRRIAQHYFIYHLFTAMLTFCEEDAAAFENPQTRPHCSISASLKPLIAAPSVAEAQQAFKKTITMAILLLLPYVPRLREMHHQYIWAQLGACFVFSDYVGSAVVTGMHRMIGTLVGGVFALLCFDWVGYSRVGNAALLVVWVVCWSLGRGSATYGYLCQVTAFSAAIMFVGSLEALLAAEQTEGTDVMVWRMKEISLGTSVYVVVELLLWPNSARRTLFEQQAKIIEAIRLGLLEAVEPFFDYVAEQQGESGSSEDSTSDSDADDASSSSAVLRAVPPAVTRGNLLVASSNASLGPASNEPTLKRRHFPRASYERVLRTESRLLRIAASLHNAARVAPVGEVAAQAPEVVTLITDYARAAELALSSAVVRAQTTKTTGLRTSWVPCAAFFYNPAELIVDGRMGKMPAMWASAAHVAAPMLEMKRQERKLRAGMADYLDRVTNFSHPNALSFCVQTMLFCMLQFSALMEELGERVRPIRSESGHVVAL